jgi:hypothetical protein
MSPGGADASELEFGSVGSRSFNDIAGCRQNKTEAGAVNRKWKSAVFAYLWTNHI